MKKLLLAITLLLAVLAIPTTASAAAVIFKPLCSGTSGVWGCPHLQFYNRTKTKLIADYQPSFPQYFSYGPMNMWRIGNPKGGSWYFTTQDWEDVADAQRRITSTGGKWRWGICFSDQTANEICLY